MKDCCIYCGDWFQCRDHLVPVSYSQSYRDYKSRDTVKACIECNKYAGSTVFFNIQDKAKFIKSQYLKHKDKILTLPTWEQEELSGIGRNLESTILKNQSLKSLYLMKLDNLELVVNGYPPIPIHSDSLSVSIPIESLKPSLEQECEHCSEPFRHTEVKRFCSDACKHDAKYSKFLNSDSTDKKKRFQFICIICSRPFNSNQPNAKYCASDCKRTTTLKEKNLFKLQCRTCGIEFIAQSERSHFCSASCNFYKERKPKITRRCPVCSDIFSTARKHQSYCSETCRLSKNKLVRERVNTPFPAL